MTFRLATASLCYLITYACSGGEMAQISTPDREQEPRLPLTTHLRQDHSTDVWAISPAWHQYVIKESQMNIHIWLRPSQVFTSLKMFSQIFRSKNGMNWIGFERPVLCTYGEMNEMTLPSRHIVQNSSPGDLSPSTLPLDHGGSTQYWIFTMRREETFKINLNARGRDEPAISDCPCRQL